MNLVLTVVTFNNTMSHFQKQDILLITGPPGCGKTATVKALANSLRVSIQEWINPTESADFVAKSDSQVGFFNPSDDIPYVSQTNSFKTFMLRANRYKVLSGLLESNADSDQNEFGAKIVLIEELPPFALRKKEDFQDILFQVKFRRNLEQEAFKIIEKVQTKHVRC